MFKARIAAQYNKEKRTLGTHYNVRHEYFFEGQLPLFSVAFVVVERLSLLGSHN